MTCDSGAGAGGAAAGAAWKPSNVRLLTHDSFFLQQLQQQVAEEEGRGNSRAVMQVAATSQRHRSAFSRSAAQELEREKKDRIAATNRHACSRISFPPIPAQLMLPTGLTCYSSGWRSCKARAMKRTPEQVLSSVTCDVHRVTRDTQPTLIYSNFNRQAPHRYNTSVTISITTLTISITLRLFCRMPASHSLLPRANCGGRGVQQNFRCCRQHHHKFTVVRVR